MARARSGGPSRPLLLTFGSVLRPDGGLQVRARVLAEELAALGMPPVVVSTRESISLTPPPPMLRAIHTPARKPRHGFSVELALLIRRAARDCDALILTNAMFMPVVALSGVRLPVLWDTNECQTLHYRRLRPTATNRGRRAAWWRLERWAARRSSLAVATGDVEAASWLAIHPQLRGRMVTVDHAPFTESRLAGEARIQLGRWLPPSAEGPVVVFVGTLAAKHNAAAASWICDVLTASLPPAVTILLCGQGTERLRPPSGGARVVGLGVVDDVDAVIASADLCIAPLASGAGVKTKVLHYLAHGRQVAGTAVAFEGLDGAPGLVEASLPRLPEVIARLVAVPESAAAAERRAALQRTWLERRHGRSRVRAQWAAALRELSGR